MPRTFISMPYTEIEKDFDRYLPIIHRIIAIEMRSGNSVSCPILVYKDAYKLIPNSSERYDKVLRLALDDLRICDSMVLLEFEGVDESVGVAAEVALANACKIPIERVNMEYFIEKYANGK